MSGFDSHELPDWVKDQFNERTALPNGPLENLPVPVEGEIMGARSCVPSDGRPPCWNADVACAESRDECMRFYEEFLPLCGYELIGLGMIQSRRNWFSHTRDINGLIVFRLAQFAGRLVFEIDQRRRTWVRAEMAHCQHPAVRDLVDRDDLRRRTDISWKMEP